MIKSFNDADTELLWQTGKTRRMPASLRTTALKKLAILHWATSLTDLGVPSGNHLEPLAGNRKGQHSIRVNQQYRLCFAWCDGDATDVEIVDYH